MKLFSHKKRPVHLGPYPLETLPRLSDPAATPPGLRGALPPRPSEGISEGELGAGHAFGLYVDLFDSQVHGAMSPRAPIPDGPIERAHHLKAGAYFLDADMVGTALIPSDAWIGEALDHSHAVVVLAAFTRKMKSKQPGDTWVDGTRQANADLRAAELAVITADYIRNLGFDAKAHTPTKSDVDLDRVALQAGAHRDPRPRLARPVPRLRIRSFRCHDRDGDCARCTAG